MADIARTLDEDAEIQAYLATVSARIGKLVAERIDKGAFLTGGPEYLRTLAATVLAVILAELADEAEAAGRALAEAAGFPEPTPDQIEAALTTAISDTMATLTADLAEAQARAQKGPKTAEAVGLPADVGTSSDSYGTGLLAVLGGILAAAGRHLTGEIAGGINVAVALAEAPPDGSATTPTRRLRTLRWVTRHDSRVCFEESGPAGTSASGVALPDNFGTCCETRHGVALPAEDWIAEGFPRDARLLCSRFGRPRCRCVLIHYDAPIPPSSLDTADATARGRQRGEEEPLDVTDTHLDGAVNRVVLDLGLRVEDGLLKIRTRRRGGVAR